MAKDEIKACESRWTASSEAELATLRFKARLIRNRQVVREPQATE